ncbi:Crp/Fnr family transcriptional regulator [Devosia sp. A16]|uniref:Crp/Fnr family transcriptional regulator n=1 Tax=Devosia sp. A16 TaxID=1736675 RepID=UPI0006D85002|nr:helix-turn-helix domain-containing protein [Devosia sp. A16]
MTTDAEADHATPSSCRHCKVRHQGLCEVLGPAELARLAGQARRTRHGAGETLTIESGEVGYANVTSGAIKLSRVLRDGRQQLVGLQFSPDLLGRLFSSESPLSAEAATEVELCRIPRSVLERLVADNDRIKLRLLSQSLRDLDDAREWMVTLGRKTAAERVASLLLLVARRIGVADADGRQTLALPIGRADMADFLGLTLETVSRQMSRLRHEGVISVRGHRCVVILNRTALEARAG